jgi:hypothetical protein
VIDSDGATIFFGIHKVVSDPWERNFIDLSKSIDFIRQSGNKVEFLGSLSQMNLFLRGIFQNHFERSPRGACG